MTTKNQNDFSDGGSQNLLEALKLGLTSITELWRYPANDWVSSIHAADIDGDNDIEVLIGSRDSSLYVLSKRGGLKWKFEGSKEWIGAVYSIDDATAVGRTRILAGSRNNRIYALDKDGRFLWDYRTNHVVRQLCVCDINQDGKLEVIAGSEDRCIYALECETGELLWKYSTNGWIRTVFAADIDGDGEIEILSGSGDKHLYVLDSQGRLKWKYNTNSKIHTIFAIDLDKDGVVEILIGSDAKTIYTLKPDCQTKWQLQTENRILSIFVADINGDGRLEVIAGSEDKHIYFLDDQGNLLWKHNLGFRVFSVYAVDLNRDGSLEVLACSEDDSVHVLHVELLDGLLSGILDHYELLGCPLPTELNLPPAECALLQDLTSKSMLKEREITAIQVEQVLESDESHQMLAAALRLSHQNVELLWCKYTGYVRTICLGDLDGDTGLEIVVGTDNGEILALDRLGNILWSHLIGDRIWTLQMEDIDLDGMIEVVVGVADGHIYALSHTGDLIKWQARMDDWIRSVYVTKPEQQGNPEIVMGSEGRKIHIYGYSDHFQPVIEPINTPHSVRAICACDIDADGIAEIIAGMDNNTVDAYTRGGILLWRYETMDRVRSLCIKDIDADGQLEIMVGSEDRNLYVLDNEGHLKWRYYTPHRVLDIDAVDIDQSGICEVFLGVGDGYVYVLSSVGDLLWRYKVGDRVRSIRAADVNSDGKIEIAVGSENQMTYLLQVLDQQQIRHLIEGYWTTLQQDRPARELIHELAQDQDPYLRAFALVTLAKQTDLLDEDFTLLEVLANDPSEHVRITFAQTVATFYQISPDQIRHFFDLLAASPERDIRLAFVDSLARIVEVDGYVGLEYLDRFTRDTDRWVRRAVVRELYQLVPAFPQHVFRLLLTTAQDEKEWIRQETARTLAHYFNIHKNNLIVGLRLLIANDIESSLIQLIAYRSEQVIVRNLFLTIAQLLLADLDEANILDRLKNSVQALQEAKSLPYGEETRRVYQELYRLHHMRTINEIAEYTYTLDHIQLADPMRFEDTLQVLRRLTEIADILGTYLRREGLGERLASLLDTITTIEKIYTDLGRVYFWINGQRSRFPDRLVFEILLIKWRAIVTAELSRLRGKADLKPELRTKLVRFEEQVGIWLDIGNLGRSPADNVKVVLKPGDYFDIIGHKHMTFESIPAHNEVRAEFTIQPKAPLLHLAFELSYDDAEGKAKVLLFGDRLELQETIHEFKHIPNAYIPGVPIQDKEMFYGRREDLEFLRENLTFTSANMIVVLYGQRRSGKSSLLYQLFNTATLEPHVSAYIDMQHESLGISTSKLLRAMAISIYRSLRKKNIAINQPNTQDFNKDPTFAFDLFLDDVEDVLNNHKLIILIDEFEILEQKVKEKALAPEIFEYMRSLMQHRRRINFLLSGTHTIEQLTVGYWSVFFNIARHHRLSRLSEEAAIQLISEPVIGFLEYDPFAVQKIRQLTADQPYLIQLICRSLIDHCNHMKKGYATINDVNTVMGEVMETGQVHFRWVWDQSTLDERLVLSILAQEGRDEGLSTSPSDIEKIYRHHGLLYDHDKVMWALQNLIGRDIIEEAVEGTRFRVPVGLIRGWLREAKPLKRVMVQERLLTQ